HELAERLSLGRTEDEGRRALQGARRDKKEIRRRGKKRRGAPRIRKAGSHGLVRRGHRLSRNKKRRYARRGEARFAGRRRRAGRKGGPRKAYRQHRALIST